jgi:hypothetical protein
MEQGFMSVDPTVKWVDSLGWPGSSAFQGEPLIGIGDTFPITPHLRAWRCSKCGLILIDYGAGVVHRQLRAKS